MKYFLLFEFNCSESYTNIYVIFNRHRQYQYISIVYEDSSYGILCKSQLENLSKNGKFCIGTTIKMSYFTTDTENQDIIKSLLRHRDTNGIY